jgi:hypothetical protein
VILNNSRLFADFGVFSRHRPNPYLEPSNTCPRACFGATHSALKCQLLSRGILEAEGSSKSSKKLGISEAKRTVIKLAVEGVGLSRIDSAEAFLHRGLPLAGLDKVDLHDRDWRLTVGLEGRLPAAPEPQSNRLRFCVRRENGFEQNLFRTSTTQPYVHLAVACTQALRAACALRTLRFPAGA